MLFPSLSDRDTAAGSARRAALAVSDRRTQRRLDLRRLLAAGRGDGAAVGACAGPVLGLLLTGAALQGASARTSLLPLAYAAGAASSLALAPLVGGRVFAAMKRSIGLGEWVRRLLGLAVLAGVVAIASAWIPAC